MHVLSSSLTSQVHDYVTAQNALAEQGFVLGGNWEYDHGSFDCALEEKRQVWLRLPFEVATGSIDSESAHNDATIKFGQPYVLNHVYNEGLDSEAHPRALGALLDQFSDPVEPDGQVESRWIEEAKRKLQTVQSLNFG